MSDQSDLELRVRTLRDELARRELESERLKKELKSMRAENLKAKEQSLIQQIQVFDKLIATSVRELENEKQNQILPQNVVKPLILKPQKKTLTPAASSVEDTSDPTQSQNEYVKDVFESESDRRTEASEEGSKVEVSIEEVKVVQENEVEQEVEEMKVAPEDTSQESESSGRNENLILEKLIENSQDSVEKYTPTEDEETIKEEIPEVTSTQNTKMEVIPEILSSRDSTLDELLSDIESDFGERNNETEYLEVSLQTRHINETFIVHEEGVATEKKHRLSESSIAEEIEEVESALDEDQTETNVTEHLSQVHSMSADIITSPIHSSSAKSPELDFFSDVSNHEVEIEDNFKPSEDLSEPAEELMCEHKTDEALVNAQSALLDIKSIQELPNFSELSPSRLPETPFLAALSRDFQRSKEIHVDKISNEILRKELDLNIDVVFDLLPPFISRSDLSSAKLEPEEPASTLPVLDLGDLSGLVSHQKELSFEEELELGAQVLLQEELRIQQEIEKIKSQTSAEDAVHYTYMREIPDKPPPPYIEPVMSVPNTETDVTPIVLAICENLYSSDSSTPLPTSKLSRVQPYYSFLFDLTKEIYDRLTQAVDDTSLEPWTKPVVSLRIKDRRLTRKEDIFNAVLSEVSELFHWKPPTRKDNFLFTWSRSRRDSVDEIIAQEAKSEEIMWTTFHKEENELKNIITDQILQELLSETVNELQIILGGTL